jgi:phosphomethylpyrimidine synthase
MAVMEKQSLTQMEQARSGVITPQMEAVAKAEGCSPEYIRQEIARGRLVIAHNSKRGSTAVGIGRGLRTKVNANIGTSRETVDIELELKKLQTALGAGADAVMDLSTGGDLRSIRRRILEASSVPVGTVPIYQAVVDTVAGGHSIARMDPERMFEVIEEQVADGVDFITVHCGITQKALEQLKESKRLLPLVSRGGTFLAEWMVLNRQENPLYEQFERLLKIAKHYDVVLSLGDGLRPGAVADATDRPQLQELITLGELTQAAWREGVAVMIEGPGHVPLGQIEANVLLEKKLCKEAPFYVLGPLVTDSAPGYDHIVAAIGGAVAAAAGADFLCYVTPAEHLSLPTLEDVRLGVIATRIAAHAADISQGVPRALERDYQISLARRTLDWTQQIALSLDAEKTNELHSREGKNSGGVCSMCGEFCALKKVKGFLEQ